MFLMSQHDHMLIDFFYYFFLILNTEVVRRETFSTSFLSTEVKTSLGLISVASGWRSGFELQCCGIGLMSGCRFLSEIMMTWKTLHTRLFNLLLFFVFFTLFLAFCKYSVNIKSPLLAFISFSGLFLEAGNKRIVIRRPGFLSEL